MRHCVHCGLGIGEAEYIGSGRALCGICQRIVWAQPSFNAELSYWIDHPELTYVGVDRDPPMAYSSCGEPLGRQA